MFTFFKAIRAAAGAHAVRILQDELPEALKRRQDPTVDLSPKKTRRDNNTVDGRNPAPPGMVKTL